MLLSEFEDTEDDEATLGTTIRLLWIEVGILMKSTRVKQTNRSKVKSIGEQIHTNPTVYENMLSHIQMVESINILGYSRLFNQGILKKGIPTKEYGFQLPENPEQHNLLIEILRYLETVAAVPMLQIINKVCGHFPPSFLLSIHS